jgi:phage terminase small subunit
MKTKKAIVMELKRIERQLCRYHEGENIQAAIKRGKCKLSETDQMLACGAAQALGWLLERNYMRPSKCVILKPQD